MHKKRYEIKCLECDETRVVEIHKTPLGDTIDWLETYENTNAYICSGRKRVDGFWGWECRCGNYSIMTAQEKEHFSNPAAPSPVEIEEVVNNLALPEASEVDGGLKVDNFLLREA